MNDECDDIHREIQEIQHFSSLESDSKIEENEKWEKESNNDSCVMKLDKYLKLEHENVVLDDTINDGDLMKVVAKLQPPEKCERGLLIAFEGGDRAGKSTQIKLLKKNLLNSRNDYNVEIYKFPSWKIIIDYIKNDQEMNDKTIHLLFSAERWEKSTEIIEKLKRGTHILLDRWAYSGVAYSAAKSGMNYEWCKMSDRGLPEPDLVCYLQVSEETAMKRSQWGESRYDNENLQIKIKENFNRMRTGRWVSFQEGTIEEIEQMILKIVKSIMTLDYEYTKLSKLFDDNCFCEDKHTVRLKKVNNSDNLWERGDILD